MHLNCTLVSSVLFVSAVLAGYPEKQQPPLLDCVERSLLIFGTITGGLVVAGMFPPGRIAHSASGRFTVPGVVRSVPDSEFNIAVGLNGYAPCPDFTLAVGIITRVFLLRNHRADWVWAGYVNGLPQNLDSKQDIAWVVTSTYQGRLLPLPDFGTVTFTNIWAWMGQYTGVPEMPGRAEIMVGDQFITETEIMHGKITIRRRPI